MQSDKTISGHAVHLTLVHPAGNLLPNTKCLVPGRSINGKYTRSQIILLTVAFIF